MMSRIPQFPALLLLLAVSACAIDEAGDDDDGQRPTDGGSGGSGVGLGGGDGSVVVSSTNDGASAGDFEAKAICPEWTAGASVHGLGHPAGNTMASATYARDMLSRGLAPNPERIRAQEFVNFYEAPYAAKDAIQLFADLVPDSLDVNASTTKYVLQIALAAPPAKLRPLSLTLVLDASGSMAGEAQMRQAAAVDAIASQLRVGDRVRILTFAGDVEEVLPLYAVEGPDDEALAAAVPSHPEGDSHVTPALEFAFEKATLDAAENPGGYLHRVMLMTDGAARLADELGGDVRELAREADSSGIFVTAVSTGPTGGYDDSLLRAVSLDGRGGTLYLDDLSGEGVGDVFRERFGEIMGVAAHDVSFELTLPTGTRLVVPPEVEADASGGAVWTQHLAPGDALVMQHEIELCALEAVTYLDAITVRATWRSPVDMALGSAEVVLSPGQQGDAAALARVRKVSALKAYADALRGPVPARIEAAMGGLQAAITSNPNDEDLAEVLSLLGNHPGRGAAE